MSKHEIVLKGPCEVELKYGENPHQKAWGKLVAGLEVYGSKPGHINLQDLSRA